jgi:hypothetical protein
MDEVLTRNLNLFSYHVNVISGITGLQTLVNIHLKTTALEFSMGEKLVQSQLCNTFSYTCLGRYRA